MPEVIIIVFSSLAVISTASIMFVFRPKKPAPELLESEIHRRRFIATGDESELSRMTKALEREGG